MHRKHRSRSSKKDKGDTNSSNNSSNTNSNVTNNSYVDNVNDNIQNINNIVGCSTNESSTSTPGQENPNQNSNTTGNSSNNATNNSSNNTSSNTSNTTSNINTQNSVNNTNNNLQNINTIILSGIEGAKAIQSDLSQMNPTSNSSQCTNASTNTASTATSSTTPPSNTDTIDKASTTLQDINNIKSQLARLDLDPRQLAYYENSIAPLLTILHDISTASYNLSSSSSILATSPIVCAKHSKLKDTIHLVYDINEECEDVYKALKKRIDLLIDLT